MHHFIALKCQIEFSSRIALLRFLDSARFRSEKVSVVTGLGMGSDWLDLSEERVSCCTRWERAYVCSEPNTICCGCVGWVGGEGK